MINLIRGSPKSPDYKRPPLRQSNGFHSPSGRPGKYDGRNGKTSCLKKTLSFALYSSILLTVLFSFTLVVVYVNCSDAVGYEIIPKSHQLCHDIYQTLQTGRIAPLTWDYKASLAEVTRITQDRFTAVVDWFKKINFTGLKDGIVAAAVSFKDKVIGFPAWISENGGQLAQSTWKLITKYFKVIRDYVVWIGKRLMHIISNGFQRGKNSVDGALRSVQKLWQESQKSAPEKSTPKKSVPEKSVPKKTAPEKSVPKTEPNADENNGPK